MQKLLLSLLFLITFMQCNTCDDCTPFAEEPFLKLRFNNEADSSAYFVIIDSINHNWAGNYEYYQDTLNTYLLPLNMNEDSSNFIITYRDTTNVATYYTNSLQIFYERTYVKRTDNNIVIQSIIKETKSDFKLSKLLCKEDSPNTSCLSNEAIFQVYR